MRLLLFTVLLFAIAFAAQHDSSTSFCEQAQETQRVNPNCIGRLVERRELENGEEEENGLVEQDQILAFAGSQQNPLRVVIPVQVPEEFLENGNDENGNGNGNNGNNNNNNGNNNGQTAQNGNGNGENDEPEGDVVYLIDRRNFENREQVLNTTADSVSQTNEEAEVRQGVYYFNSQVQREQQLGENNVEQVEEAIREAPEENNSNNNGRVVNAMQNTIQQAQWNNETANVLVVMTGEQVNNNNNNGVETLRQRMEQYNVSAVFIVPENRQEQYQQFLQRLGVQGRVIPITEETQPETISEEIVEVIEEHEDEEIPEEDIIRLVLSVQVLNQTNGNNNNQTNGNNNNNQTRGIWIQPVAQNTTYEVRQGDELRYLPVTLQAYTTQCLTQQEFIERTVERVQVRITLTKENEQQEERQQTVELKLLRCPCELEFEQNGCGYFR
ncbi:hypothetical protein RCL1_005088 [Eukaryota sp. TZLM3-RCL]